MLLASRGEVHAYDLSSPAAPRHLGVYAAAGSVNTLIVTGDLLVIAGATDGSTGFIEIVDFASPSAPRRLDHQHDRLGAVLAAAVDGELLYVARYGRLDVWDIGQPDELEHVSTMESPDIWFDHLVARGGYLYGAGRARLTVLDARDPNDLREVFTTDSLAGWYFGPSALAFVGDTLVMPWRNVNLGVWLFDVTDPAHPRPAGVFGAGGSIADLTVVGQRVAYLFDEDLYSQSDPRRLRITDVDGVMDLRLLGRHGSVGFAESVTVSGDLAFVTGWPDGLTIVDIADPSAPRRLSGVALPRGADRVAVFDEHAYVISPWTWARADNEASTVEVIDVSDPQRPQIVASIAREGSVQDLSVADARLYLAETSGLSILDLRADPASPREIGRLPSRASEQGRYGEVSHVVVAGDRAVIADVVFEGRNNTEDDGEADELRVVDVSDPTQPSVVGAVTLGTSSPWSHIRGLDLAWPLAYAYTPTGVDDADNFVHVVDVANPAGPRSVASWQPQHKLYGTSLSVAGKLAFVGSWFGIAVLDTATAADPQTVAEIITPGLSYAAAELDVDASGGLYFANGEAGLVLLRVEPDLLPTPTPGPSPTKRPLPTALPTATPTLPPATSRPPVSPTPDAIESPPPVATPSPIYLPWAEGDGPLS